MSEIGRPPEKHANGSVKTYTKKYTPGERFQAENAAGCGKSGGKLRKAQGELIHTSHVDYHAFSTETSGIGYLIWLRLKMRPPVRMAVAARKAAPRPIP